MVAAAFDPFAPGSAETLALFGARVGGMMLVAPSFSSNLVSRQARVALTVVLTVLLQPAALASVHGVPAMTATAFLSETIIGFAIGFGAALFIGAAETAGDVMSIQIGLSGAAILDPTDLSSTTREKIREAIKRSFEQGRGGHDHNRDGHPDD